MHDFIKSEGQLPDVFHSGKSLRHVLVSILHLKYDLSPYEPMSEFDSWEIDVNHENDRYAHSCVVFVPSAVDILENISTEPTCENLRFCADPCGQVVMATSF